MASLTRKVINGHSYYYVRHCQRVDGRPKIVKTTYLGSVDNIVQAVEAGREPIPPKTAEIASLGDVAVLYSQAERIGLVECIDAQVPKRHQGLSVGQYMLLAAIKEIFLVYLLIPHDAIAENMSVKGLAAQFSINVA